MNYILYIYIYTYYLLHNIYMHIYIYIIYVHIYNIYIYKYIYMSMYIYNITVAVTYMVKFGNLYW